MNILPIGSLPHWGDGMLNTNIGDDSSSDCRSSRTARTKGTSCLRWRSSLQSTKFVNTGFRNGAVEDRRMPQITWHRSLSLLISLLAAGIFVAAGVGPPDLRHTIRAFKTDV